MKLIFLSFLTVLYSQDSIDVDYEFWGQNDEECNEIGDVNFDYLINILDVILLISYILDSENLDYQQLIISDINEDNNLDILDVVNLVSLILN